MKSAIGLLLLGALVLTLVIAVGLPQGNFFDEGSILLSLYWGRVTLIDLYLAFFIFLGWVWFREKNLWVFLLMTLLTSTTGSIAIALYAAHALYKSGGDLDRFFYKNRRP